MNSKIAIILVETETPDNIGAAARALKNMGLSDLRLVKPPVHWKEKGKKMAMSAFDVLQTAKVFPSLEEAAADCYLVVGTSRRLGAKRGNFVSFDKALQKIKSKSIKYQTALVFGKESKGLDNASLGICDFITTIPSHPDYPSLNLAQAVMVCAFMLSRQGRKEPFAAGVHDKAPKEEWIPQGAISELLGRFRNALEILDYSEEGADMIDRILATFRGLIKRNGLLESEAQMFKGLSRRIESKVQKRAPQFHEKLF